MRVGILTSWNVPCGIFGYSARFAAALLELGHTPVILAGVGDASHSLPDDFGYEVHRVADIGNWRDDHRYSFDVDAVLEARCDVIHVQYQSSLFREPDLACLRKAFAGPLAITYHDNCLLSSFPADIFDRAFTHRSGVGMPGAVVMAMPIEIRKPIVCTFGLGRSRADLIQKICERHGWLFDNWSSHGLVGHWIDHEVLMDRLRSSDAIVLWYEDAEMAGSSSAARQAISARRPVYTNDTTWFADMPSSALPGRYKKCGSLRALEVALAAQFYEPSYVAERSWRSAAQQMVESYAAVAR